VTNSEKNKSHADNAGKHAKHSNGRAKQSGSRSSNHSGSRSGSHSGDRSGSRSGDRSGGVNMRELALETLFLISRDGKQSHLVIRDVLEKYAYLPARDKAFYMRLVEGTIEYRLRLDYIINYFSKTRTSKMKPVIREILRMGVYQIVYMDSVPDSAAVNESVRLAVKKSFSGLRGFVNGVLRSVSAKLFEVKYPVPEEDFPKYLEVAYSMPQYLSAKWIAEYGREKTEEICASFLKERPLTVRFRNDGQARKAAEELPDDGHEHPYRDELDSTVTAEILKELTDNDVFAAGAAYVKNAWNLAGMRDPQGFEAFREGKIVVQDVSSQLAVRAAGIKAGDRVLDLCAAPGGKSLLAADLLCGRGEVVSRDLTPFKMELIRQNIERCHAELIRPECFDATVRDEESVEAFDVVIADVPCSGYGVIGRKPDIKYRADEENQRALVDLQRQILTNAAAYVKPGGTLLFSTCTIGKAENADTVDWLLRNFPLTGVELAPLLPEELKDDAEGCMLQLLPGVHPCDGFFFARFRKNGENA